MSCWRCRRDTHKVSRSAPGVVRCRGARNTWTVVMTLEAPTAALTLRYEAITLTRTMGGGGVVRAGCCSGRERRGGVRERAAGRRRASRRDFAQTVSQLGLRRRPPDSVPHAASWPTPARRRCCSHAPSTPTPRRAQLPLHASVPLDLRHTPHRTVNSNLTCNYYDTQTPSRPSRTLPLLPSTVGTSPSPSLPFLPCTTLHVTSDP